MNLLFLAAATTFVIGSPSKSTEMARHIENLGFIRARVIYRLQNGIMQGIALGDPRANRLVNLKLHSVNSSRELLGLWKIHNGEEYAKLDPTPEAWKEAKVKIAKGENTELSVTPTEFLFDNKRCLIRDNGSSSVAVCADRQNDLANQDFRSPMDFQRVRLAEFVSDELAKKGKFVENRVVSKKVSANGEQLILEMWHVRKESTSKSQKPITLASGRTIRHGEAFATNNRFSVVWLPQKGHLPLHCRLEFWFDGEPIGSVKDTKWLRFEVCETGSWVPCEWIQAQYETAIDHDDAFATYETQNQSLKVTWLECLEFSGANVKSGDIQLVSSEGFASLNWPNGITVFEPRRLVIKLSDVTKGPAKIRPAKQPKDKSPVSTRTDFEDLNRFSGTSLRKSNQIYYIGFAIAAATLTIVGYLMRLRLKQKL